MDRFWDIESYDNLFCVSFLDDNDHLDMFHLCADEDIADVERACRDSGYEYTRYDLRTDGEKLKEYMANPIPSDGKPTLLSTFLGTENPVVEPKEDWYFAYNCLNYDVPMIDYVLKSMVSGGSAYRQRPCGSIPTRSSTPRPARSTPFPTSGMGTRWMWRS